jgi:Zn-dependent protease
VQTLHGIRFLSVARVDGMQLGLDARWLDVRGLGLLVLLMLATMVSQNVATPLWVRLSAAAFIVPAILLTSLGHELGHVLASRLAGLSVRAVVLAPQGGVTIRAGSDAPAVNFCTALAGPLANAILGVMCIWLAVVLPLEDPLNTFLFELAALQLLTAAANLAPVGAMDGHRMLEAWRAAAAPSPALVAAD